jgi:choline dehydrogenase-like flavoprotein
VTGAEDGALTRDERKYRNRLWFHAALSLAFLISYTTRGTTELGYIPNSVGKDALFVVISAIAALHVRRHGWLVIVIALGYAGLILGQLITLLAWRSELPEQDLLGLVELSPTIVLLGWATVDVVLTAWLLHWWFRAERARHQLKYLHPLAFLSLASLSEVLIKGQKEVLSPLQIAHNVDGYLYRLQARTKGRIQWALGALFPFRALQPPAREHVLESIFIVAAGRRRLPGFVRRIVQAAIRVASQMTYLGYYGDKRSWDAVKFTPYSKRDHRPQSAATHIGPRLRSLAAPPREPDYDAIVVGSGAAGGLLAYRWAKAGRKVLVLERGPHVDPRSFNEDEVEQYLKLYNEGALQLATDFRLSLLQGMCVGGGTTVNNALCLDPPDAVLTQWSRRGLDPVRLRTAIEQVRSLMHVQQLPATAVSEASRRFAAAAARLPGRTELMHANILGTCRGCGYCNIGCPFGAKVSVLDSLLPLAQKQDLVLDVLPDFEVTRLVTEGDKAVSVEGRHAGRDWINLAAGEIIVAAGAVHSSWLLQNSGLAPGRAGNGLHFNINSPLTADFEDPVDSFDGIQMAHAHFPEGDVPPFVLETWFNPPATQALAMPGWFEQHFENMSRYRHMASAGALTGTTTPGRVRHTKGGPAIDFKPSRNDLGRVVDGLKLTAEVFLDAGARRAMPATYLWHEFTDADQLHVLDRYVRDNGDLQLTSAHPQGGNAIGDREEGAVVGPDFRVHGFANLFLCDASVFPTSVGVNPQLTVMGLAQYAANETLAG